MNDKLNKEVSLAVLCLHQSMETMISNMQMKHIIHKELFPLTISKSTQICNNKFKLFIVLGNLNHKQPI